MSSAAKVLQIARAEIGVKESPSGSNRVKYNNNPSKSTVKHAMLESQRVRGQLRVTGGVPIPT